MGFKEGAFKFAFRCHGNEYTIRRYYSVFFINIAAPPLLNTKIHYRLTSKYFEQRLHALTMRIFAIFVVEMLSVLVYNTV